MRRDALNELFDYTGWAWERIALVIDGLPPDQFAMPVPGSGWPSLSACFAHFVGAYDGWINGPWALGLGERQHPGDEALQSWPAMKQFRTRGREAFRHAIDVPNAVLYEKRAMDLGGPEPERLSRADILGNLLLHERGHHGDLNTLFHAVGVRSYIIDYRAFVGAPEVFVADSPGD